MFATEGALWVKAVCTHSAHLGAAARWQLTVTSDPLLLRGDSKGLTGKPPWNKEGNSCTGASIHSFPSLRKTLFCNTTDKVPVREPRLDLLFYAYRLQLGSAPAVMHFCDGEWIHTCTFFYLLFICSAGFHYTFCTCFHTHTIPVEINGSPMCGKSHRKCNRDLHHGLRDFQCWSKKNFVRGL